MRTCLVSRLLPSPNADGPSRYAWEAASALAAAGHEVHVLTGEAEQGSGEGGAVIAGVIYHRVDLSSGRAAIPQAYPTRGFHHAMGVYDALLRLHAERAFDYIEFPLAGGEGYFALRAKRTLGELAGAVLGVRLCTPAADRRRENLDSRFDGEAAFEDHMETASMREADLLVSPTAALLELLRGRIEDDAAWPTPEMAVVQPPRGRREWDGSWRPVEGEGERTVLLAGPLEERRGVRGLVEMAKAAAARGEAGVRFSVVGPDTPTAPIGRSMEGYLRGRCAGAGEGIIEVREGEASGEERLAAMRGAAVVCFPGTMHEPEWGLLDAAALGAPVVAADCPGVRELGLEGVRLVAAGSLAALAEGVGEALRGGNQCRGGEVGNGEFARQLVAAVEAARGRGTGGDVADAGAEGAGGGGEGGGDPEVTVVVPVFNLGRYLPQTLASIDAQTMASREVIIVDDGSTDPETVEVLGRLEREGRRVIRQANAGASAARNTGLREARGRWVAFIDADDLIEPEYLRTLTDVLRGNPRLGYASALVRCFENDDPLATTAGWIPLGMAGFDRDLVLCMNVGGIAGSVFDTAMLRAARGYDERMPSYEDWDLWCRLAERGVRGAIVPAFIFAYRVRQDSKYRRLGLATHAPLKSHLLAHHAAAGLVTSRTLRLLYAEAASAEAGLRASQEETQGLRRALREAEAKTDGALLKRTEEAERSAAEAWRNAGELEEVLKRNAAELAEAHRRLAELEGARAEAASKAEGLAVELAAARAQAAELAERLASVEREAAGTAERLRRESAERARLERRLDEATVQTLLAGERLTRALADLAAAEGTIAMLRHQLATHDCSVHTRRVLEENIRYRVVDRMNSAIKGSGVHSVAKAIVRRAAAPPPNGQGGHGVG